MGSDHRPVFAEFTTSFLPHWLRWFNQPLNTYLISASKYGCNITVCWFPRSRSSNFSVGSRLTCFLGVVRLDSFVLLRSKIIYQATHFGSREVSDSSCRLLSQTREDRFQPEKSFSYSCKESLCKRWNWKTCWTDSILKVLRGRIYVSGIIELQSTTRWGYRLGKIKSGRAVLYLCFYA